MKNSHKKQIRKAVRKEIRRAIGKKKKSNLTTSLEVIGSAAAGAFLTKLEERLDLDKVTDKVTEGVKNAGRKIGSGARKLKDKATHKTRRRTSTVPAELAGQGEPVHSGLEPQPTT